MNMSKKHLIIGLIVILFVGLFVFQNRFSKTDNSSLNQERNVDMLQNGNQTPITSKTDLEYFPGAKGYFVRPEQEGNYPGVVMIHENRGLRPEIKMTADQLAKEGYVVLAVDLYNGKVVETQEDARALSSGFDQKTGVENMKSAVKYLREQGVSKIASLGWCFGGRQSVELSISGEKLDATIVYYGGNMATTTDRLAPIKWPVLGIFGDQDQAIPVKTVKEFETSLNTLGVDNEIHIYPGVGHAFANPSGANYAPEATKDAWGKTTAFLEKYLK